MNIPQKKSRKNKNEFILKCIKLFGQMGVLTSYIEDTLRYLKLKGEMQVEAYNLLEHNPEKLFFDLKAGEGIKLSPHYYHVMTYKTDCEQLSILDEAFDNDNPDIQRC